MDLTMLLIGISITAGIHIVLFVLSSCLAWMYYKRFTRLQERLRRDELRWFEDPGRDIHDRQIPRERRQTFAARARRDRQQRRRQEDRERQEGGALSSISDEPSRPARGGWLELQPEREQSGGAPLRSRGHVDEDDQRSALT